VDFAGTLTPRRRVVFDAAGADARQRRIELRLADEEREVLRPEILARIKIERDAIGGLHRREMAPFRPGFQVQDIGEEFRRYPFVARRDDRVVRHSYQSPVETGSCDHGSRIKNRVNASTGSSYLDRERRQEPARAAGNGRWGNRRRNARHPQRLVDINQRWRAMEDNSLESRAAYFRSVAERLRGIAAGLRYDLRRA